MGISPLFQVIIENISSQYRIRNLYQNSEVKINHFDGLRECNNMYLEITAEFDERQQSSNKMSSNLAMHESEIVQQFL
jgi:hypothetical protein